LVTYRWPLTTIACGGAAQEAGVDACLIQLAKLLEFAATMLRPRLTRRAVTR